MAVYERVYRSYSGPLTAEWSRFLVIARYELRRTFGSRVFSAFFALCFVWPLTASLILYVAQNLHRLAEYVPLPLQGGLEAVTFDIGAWHAHLFLRIQAISLGFVLALVAGPPLISADTRNNGLPLYLSRPVTRTEYVAGKASVLFLLISAVSWVPGLLLFALQGYLAGPDWLAGHWSLAPRMTLAALLWITVLTLLTLAVSALVKLRTLARAALFGFVLLGSGLANAINANLDSTFGDTLSLIAVTESLWARLLDSGAPATLAAPTACIALGVLCAGCLLILAWRVRAYEVVR